MEDIDGGLHPAVDGQSLDDEDDEFGEKPSQLYLCHFLLQWNQFYSKSASGDTPQRGCTFYTNYNADIKKKMYQVHQHHIALLFEDSSYKLLVCAFQLKS